MLDDMQRYLLALEDLTNNKNKTVNKKDYELFCREFVFAKVKGISFGEAFCERFGFNNTFLKNLSDKTAQYHIEKLGYVKI
jgi:thermostable 8-oxoguanine DNA glycosylase